MLAGHLQQNSNLLDVSQDETLEAIGVEESIDLQSLNLLHRKANSVDVEDASFLNSTYVQQKSSEDPNETLKNELQLPLNGEGSHNSQSAGPLHTRSTSDGPLGSSTPQRGSPVFERRMRSNGDPVASAAYTPNVQSGRDTYSVRNSAQHRPASQLFVDSGESTTELQSERPKSEIIDGNVQSHLRGFAMNKQRAAEEKQSSLNNVEVVESSESSDDFRSLRAEMEMRRVQIQNQRAKEEKERVKQRQKVTEVAFFKAIQPRTQSFSQISSNGLSQTPSRPMRNPSMTNISVQTSIDTPDSSYSVRSVSKNSHYDEYLGEPGVAPTARSGSEIHRTASLDWLVSVWFDYHSRNTFGKMNDSMFLNVVCLPAEKGIIFC